MASDGLRKFRLRRAEHRVARKPKLPDIAKKADDLEAIKEAVDSAATVSGALWLSYLFVMFYIAVAAGAVTHEDLLLQRPVKLPFLNVELPLLAFFFLAPLLFVATHVYTIVHFNMLGQKAARFHSELHNQLKDEKEIRDKLRRLLPSNVLVQIFAGPPELRDGRFGLILKAIVILTLVACPVFLLLLLQIQFLPHHSGWITWTQRGALIFDIAILWILRPPTLLNGVGGWSFHGGEAGTAPKRVHVMRGAGLALTGVLSLLAVWLSVTVATIPGEWQEKNLSALDPRIWRNPNDAQAEEVPLISTRERLFAGEVDVVTRRRKSPFSNTLVLPSLDIYVALKVDDKKKLDWKDYLIDLRGRALDGAVLDGAKLPKADLTGTHLEASSLSMAQLQGASLYRAQLQGASLVGTKLQGAILMEANLIGASLVAAHLEGALLNRVKLQGASLDGAQLKGASLAGVKLQCASLAMAQLQGSLLSGALLGTSLDRAQLQGAILVDSNLWRSDWGRDFNYNEAKPIVLKNIDWGPPAEGKEEGSIFESYADLQREMESIPNRKQRDTALRCLIRLACNNSDKSLASCDYNIELPEQVKRWQDTLNSAGVDNLKTLALTLRSLVCEGGENGIHILRGLRTNSVLDLTGTEVPALVDQIMSPSCPVSAALSSADKAELLQTKNDAQKKTILSITVPPAETPAKSNRRHSPRDRPPP